MPEAKLIEGVKLKKLRLIPDERGRLMEILRADDPDFFVKFGQVYVTSVYPGVVKAWHYHRHQFDNFCCVQGMVKVALYDSRPDSPTYKRVNEFFIGVYNPLLMQIPPLVYHGFKGAFPQESLVINVPTELYNYEEPDEYRVDPYDNDIPYEWGLKEG